MRLLGKYCRCNKCAQVYVLIDGYNDTDLCFWCKQGIPFHQREKKNESGTPAQ